MCRETVGIALCAPVESPHLSYTCGRLHNIAACRESCDQIKGGCNCFFGTCGRIETVTNPQAVDFATIPKVRCLDCTKREDETGYRREGLDLADSPLLNRVPIPEEVLGVHLDVLKTLWKGADKCVFHDVNNTDASCAEEEKLSGTNHENPSITASDTKESRASSHASNKSVEEITHHLQTSGIAPHLGIQASRWAEGSDKPQGEPEDDSKKRSSSQAPSAISIRSTRSLPINNSVEKAEPIDSIFDLKNLPGTLPDFAAMKAFLARI